MIEGMTSLDLLALALDPTRLLKAQGLSPDPWQERLLFATHRHILLNCCRQSGKSTTVAALALHTALTRPGSLILVLSPTLRQSGEFFRKVKQAYHAVGRPLGTRVENQVTLELTNHSRIVSLPGKEGTVRSFSRVALLIIDEASKVPDDLYYTVRPMLAVSGGRLICLSTPFGQRGFFWKEWLGNGPWHKVEITWKDCSRITPAFIEEERRSMGDNWIRQEYECCFTAMEGLVYPDFSRSHTDIWTPPDGQLIGGIDWGFRAPFAAVWGFRDRDDVLHIQDERYLRETSLLAHARELPRDVLWYADPAGATEVHEFRLAGHLVRKAFKEIRLGVQTVAARLRTGRLQVHNERCPNLCAEALLYRYPDSREGMARGELPLDENNHALDALRYLITGIDRTFVARLRQRTAQEDSHQTPICDHNGEQMPGKSWLNVDNPELWTDLP
jgi:hypothetical protein